MIEYNTGEDQLQSYQFGREKQEIFKNRFFCNSREETIPRSNIKRNVRTSFIKLVSYKLITQITQTITYTDIYFN